VIYFVTMLVCSCGTLRGYIVYLRFEPSEQAPCSLMVKEHEPSVLANVIDVMNIKAIGPDLSHALSKLGTLEHVELLLSPPLASKQASKQASPLLPTEQTPIPTPSLYRTPKR
jgi:hypothetical protein